VEPDETSIAKKRLGKHFPAATNTHATIEESFPEQQLGKHTTIGVLLETVFSVQLVQNGYKE
jgi:hypothetical protein